VTVDVDLGGYVAGGYWLVRPAARPAWCDARYVADPLVSCSGCLLRGGVGPSKDGWCSFEDDAADLGVSAERVADARAWVVDHDDLVGPEHTWSSPAPLLEFVERFIANGPVMVLGVALPAEQARAWAGSSWGGPIAELLTRGAPPAPGGVPLGWEPVECHAHAVMCSWTCNSLQDEVAEQIELRFTKDGLLPDQTHADEVMRVVDTLDKEIGPWAAFLLVRYGPEPRGPFRELVYDACEISLEDLEGLELPPDLLDRGAEIPFEFPADIPWPPTAATESANHTSPAPAH
jgi:hypothetical protein